MTEPFAPIIVEDEPKKPFWKRRWIWIVAAVLVVIVIGVIASQKPEDSGISTITVERATLVRTIEASGELESAEDLSLALEASGIVDHVFVQIGDFVHAGDLLLTLGGGTRLSSVVIARRALRTSEARLDQFLAGASEEEIAVQSAIVDAAQSRLDSADLDLRIIVNQREFDVLDSKIALVQSMQASMIEVRDALAEADQILGIENTLANDLFENDIAVNDPQTLTDAQASYSKAREMRDRYEHSIFDIDASMEISSLLSVAADVERTLRETENALRNTRRALDATRSNTAALPLSEVAVFQASVDTARDGIQIKRESLQSKRKMVRSLTIDESVALARETIVLRKTELAQAESNLQAKISQKRSSDVAVYEADVQRAFADVESAQTQFDQLELRAPIDGTITDVITGLGEPVSAYSGVVGMQSFGSLFTVKTLISESDIVRVNLNQRATITFDAFGEDVEFVGRVVLIHPSEKKIEGVIFFETEIVLTDVIREGLRPGLTADVTIETLRIDDAISIPQRALLRNEDGVTVRVQVGEEIEERHVTIGERGDGGQIEILTGLNVDDTVVTSIAE